MSTADDRITQTLEQFIDQTKAWLAEPGAHVVEDLKIRKFPTVAEPLATLDDSHRKERHGIRFRLNWEGSSGPGAAELELRIDPYGAPPKNGPYVIFYIKNNDGEFEPLRNWEIVEAALIDPMEAVVFFGMQVMRLLRDEGACAACFRYKLE